MKGVQLVTALGEFIIEESVDEIVERKNKCGELGDLEFTIANVKDKTKSYKASTIGGLYRAVREVELPEPKKD